MNLSWKFSKPTFESDNLNNDLHVSPWSGHRYFVYDLLRFAQPEVVVELGSHFGCSFFAFCQAIKDYHLATKVVGIDTWRGDEHAGFYGEDVFQLVNETISLYYRDVSLELKRMFFSEAVHDFENESIDLLHIDGLHTYEAVKEDFETWFPKLKKDGIVLFHDVADYTGYGSHLYWEELKQNFPCHFEFHHSWGLGVLFPKGSALYQKLLDQNIRDKVLIYQYYADLMLYRVKLKDVEQMTLDRYNSMQNMEQMIKERDAAITAQAKVLEERYNAVNRMEHMIVERDEANIVQATMLDERYAAMQEMERMIKERDEGIQGQAKLLEERYGAMQEMERMIKERDEGIQGQAKLLEERYDAMQEMDRMIRERDETIQAQANILEERYAAIQNMENLIEHLHATISSLSATTDRYSQELEFAKIENQDLKDRLAKITKYLFWLRK